MLFNRHVWTDKRILLAIPVAFALRYAMNMAMVGTFVDSTGVDAQVEQVGLHPSAPREDASRAAGDTLLLERRIKKINLDGSDASDPLSPVAAAAAFGGAILLVGGTLSILSWRKAALEEKQARRAPQQDPVVRNAAQPGPGR